MATQEEGHVTQMDITDPRMTSGEGMGIGRYLATRIPTLKPPVTKIPNPIYLLSLLNFQQWMFFLVAFLGWTWYASFTVSVAGVLQELIALVMRLISSPSV